MTRLAFPYGFDAEGRSSTVAYGSDAHLRDMLELLILTLVGERVMRPDLGSPVLQMVFEAGEGAVGLALSASLEAAIAQWLDPVLQLDRLSAQFLEDQAILEVGVIYRNRASGQRSELRVRKDLA